MDITVLVAIYGLYRIFKQYRQRTRSKDTTRRWWVHPLLQDRAQCGFYVANFNTMVQNPEKFFRATRMSPEAFRSLLAKIQHKLEKSSLRTPLSPEFRLFHTLIFLAHGPDIPFLSWSFKIGESTSRSIIHEVCDVLWSELKGAFLPELTTEDWSRNATQFYQQWDLPNCCGAVDGKHVKIECPPNSGSQFFNYKGEHSINLMAVCDADYKFLSVDVGAYGGNSDGGVFASSEFGKRLFDGSLNLPPAACLPNSDIEIPHYIVGDAAFPLKPNLMRPFPGKLLPPIRENFNKRLSRARRTIENAFGILVARWRILKTTLVMLPKNAEKIVLASIVLHNYLKESDNDVYCPQTFTDTFNAEGEVIRPGDWRNESQPLEGCSGMVRGNNSSQKAFEVRNLLSEFVFTHRINH